MPVSLTTSPRSALAAVHVQLFLALSDVGQHRTEPLVLDNGCLVDPLQPVKGAVGQVDAVMADRQTTGGYPKIATVIAADIAIAGQLAPSDAIVFRVCTAADALKALIVQERALMALEGPRP